MKPSVLAGSSYQIYFGKQPRPSTFVVCVTYKKYFDLGIQSRG